jgi:hypothetical protein
MPGRLDPAAVFVCFAGNGAGCPSGVACAWRMDGGGYGTNMAAAISMRWGMGAAKLGVIGLGLYVGAATQVLAADPPKLSVELNKLEPVDKGCTAYMVVTNPAETAYQSVKLDLVLFQPDGVIAKRISVDLAPVKPAKTTVKLFDIPGVECAKIANVLVNDVIECKSDAGVQTDCLARMAVTSVAAATLKK